ncbi:hypothetical protein CR513_38674, partial [Mucuna pruriens]
MYHVPPKVFGCVCFVHDVSLSRNKLSTRAIKCVFLGYSRLQKGYKCYSSFTKRHYLSADVTFFEETMFFSTKDDFDSIQQALPILYLRPKRWVLQYVKIHLIHILYPQLTPHRILLHSHLPMILTLVDSLLSERNPGGTPEWLGNFVIAAFIASLLSLTLGYLLSYVHLSGAKKAITLATLVLFSLSLAIVLSGVIPPFSEDTARAVNVVHVVDATGKHDEGQNPISYVSFFSNTPGNLDKEIEQINEGLVCGKDKTVDFVTFSVKYGCWTYNDTANGWSEMDIPTMNVVDDAKGNGRITQVSINTKASIRWALAINTEEIEDFEFKDARNSEELISVDKKSSVGGWHIIQFSGGKSASTLFDLTLYWRSDSTYKSDSPLLKLRTDVDRLTPITERVLKKLPRWCSLFGKSTSPLTLAFLTNLPE